MIIISLLLHNISQNLKSNLIQAFVGSNMSSSIKNPLQKLFKTEGQAAGRQQNYSRQLKADSFYNLKDFLPNTTSLNTDQRLKTKSTLYSKAQSTTNNTKYSNFAINNIEQKVIEQRMNKLKEENFILKQKLTQQQQKTKNQTEEIEKLRKIIDKINRKQENKTNNMKMWSYKYHVEYSPKQKHKYQLAIQTDDSYNQQGGLRAKDFQDIYKKLNSNPSMIQLNKNKTRKQSINLKLIPDFSIQKNTSTVASNKNSTLKLTKHNKQNNSSLFKIPKIQDYLNCQNKQNLMYKSNVMMFDKNPMEINLEKMIQAQKPIKQQFIEIYPVEEGYLDSIIGQILCGDD